MEETKAAAATTAPAPIESFKSGEKFEEIAALGKGASVLLSTEKGPVSGTLVEIESTEKSVVLLARGTVRKIVFAALLLGAVVTRAAAADMKHPHVVTLAVESPGYLTQDGSARAALDASRALVRTTAVVIREAATANATAQQKCRDAAAAAKPPVTLPDPRDAAGTHAYIEGCRGVGVPFPFDVQSLQSAAEQTQAAGALVDDATLVRLMVKGRETDAWRLPATMERVAGQVGSLLSAIQTAKLAVPPEAIAATRRSFGAP